MEPTRVRNIQRQERPQCPRCRREMQLIRVASCDHEERWIYHCAACGNETSIVIESLA